FAFTQKPKQNVLGADVGMIERFRLFTGECQNFFHARCVGNVTNNFRFRPRANLFLDFHAHGLEIESHFLKHVDRDALTELDQPEQKMLGANIIMVETVRFFASELQDLLGTGSEIVHCSVDAGLEPLPASRASLLISGLGSTFKRVRIIWARRGSRSSALSFCCELLCRCAG